MTMGDLYSVSKLPDCLQRALVELGYLRPNVSVLSADAVSLGDHGADGYQAFAAVVRLDTGDSKVQRGSWDGPSAISASAIDNDHGIYPIPEGVAVVKGDRGGVKDAVYARVYVHPASLEAVVSSPLALLKRERAILEAHATVEPFSRRAELRRIGIELNEGDINRLVERGFMKRNSLGSPRITMAGRSAIARR